MASTIVSNLALFLALLSLSPSAVNASWKMVANTIVTGRVDPLINPGVVSGVRRIHSLPAMALCGAYFLWSHGLTFGISFSMCMTTLVGTTLASRMTTTICEQAHAPLSKFKTTRVATGLPQCTTKAGTAHSHCSNPLIWSIIFIGVPTKRPSPRAFE